jgi:hypothetical protein
MSNTIRSLVPGDAMLAAPRQLWLAALGASAAARNWAQTEAGTMFRTLVDEGAAVEARALRAAGERFGTSLRRAARIARDARNGVEALTTTASALWRAKVAAPHARRAPGGAPARRGAVGKTARRARKAAKSGRAKTRTH